MFVKDRTLPLFTVRFPKIACICFLPLICLPSWGAAKPAEDPADQQWQALLGENAQKQWRGYGKEGWPEGWKLEEGILHRHAGGGDLMTVGKFANFELRLEWKISPKGNSGIMYRVSKGDAAAYFSGPEYQILDDSGHKDGKNDKTSAATLYALYARSGGKLRPVGKWNKTRIVVAGNHVQHWLNDQKVVEFEIDSPDWNERVAKSKFAEWPNFGKNKTGHIVLQDHGDPVWYRNIQVRSLKTQ